MAQSIDGSISQVRKIVAAIDGIRAAPDGVPDSAKGIYPFFVCWNGGGETRKNDNSFQTGLWTIVAQLHFSRSDLYRAEAFASPFPAKIVNELLSKTNYNLDSNCETFGPVTVGRFGPLMWGDVPTVGFEFTISNVKINRSRDA